MQIHGPVADPEADVCPPGRGYTDIGAPHGLDKVTLLGCERAVVRLEERTLVVGVYRGLAGKRLSGQRERAAVVGPVKVDGPPDALIQPVLKRAIRRLPRSGPWHHDRAVDITKHLFVGGPGVGIAATKDLRVPPFGKRLLDHVHDAEVDRASLHQRVPHVRHYLVENPWAGKQQDPLSRFWGKLGDQPLGHPFPIHRETGLCHDRGRTQD